MGLWRPRLRRKTSPICLIFSISLFLLAIQLLMLVLSFNTSDSPIFSQVGLYMSPGTESQISELSIEQTGGDDNILDRQIRDNLYIRSHNSYSFAMNESLFDRLLDLPSASVFLASPAAKLLPGVFETAPDTHDASQLDQHLQSLLVQKAPKMEQLRPLFFARRAQYRSIGLYERALQFTSAHIDGFSHCIPVAASHPAAHSLHHNASSEFANELECSGYVQRQQAFMDSEERSPSPHLLWMNDVDAAVPLHWRRLPRLHLLSSPEITLQPQQLSRQISLSQVQSAGERLSRLSRRSVAKWREPHFTRFLYCGAQPHALHGHVHVINPNVSDPNETREELSTLFAMGQVRAAFARVRRGGAFSPSTPASASDRSLTIASVSASVSTPEPEATAAAAATAGVAPAPVPCVARSRLAIVLPYRSRRENLGALLAHLHPLLQRHRVDYRVFVVEQIGNYTFNKARLMNAAFLEIAKRHRFDCYVFHDVKLLMRQLLDLFNLYNLDVDLVPEDDRNIYKCRNQPFHLSVAVDKLNYQLTYYELVGGVLSLPEGVLLAVNGYSNMFWGWGAEDDDLAYRLLHVGFRLTRPPTRTARYSMLRHHKRAPAAGKRLGRLLYLSKRRLIYDGLSNLRYRLVAYSERALYTYLLVHVGTENLDASAPPAID